MVRRFGPGRAGRTRRGGGVAPLSWIVIAGFRVGFAGALDLLLREQTLSIVVNSFLLVGAVTGLSVLLAVPLAFLTTRTNLPFRRFFTVALAMPLVVPSYIGAFAFVSAFGPQGQLQDALAPFGVETLPTIYGLVGSTLVLTLYTYPYVYITTRASLKSLDTTLVEAARTLRHTRWQAFKRVTLPQIRPAITAGSLLVALYALSDFGTPAIMRYDVFTRVIYVEFNAFGRNMAALLSLVLVLITVAILAFERRAGGEDRVQTDRGHGNTQSLVRLGRWRWPAAAFCGGVTALALVVPLGILGLWLVRGTDGVAGGLAFELQYVGNSVGIAVAAALVAAIVGLPIAHLSARGSSRFGDVFERASYVGYAVPGVVIGLALVFLGARYGGGLYRTGVIAFPLLVFGYVVRFLPQAVGSTRASLLRVSPALPEAARTLGRSPFGAFRSVTLPLIAPGQVGGAALVFLTTMKELPVTLLLKPPGFDTLVTQVWQATASGHYGHAAVPSLILLFVSALSMLVILSMEGYDVK
ncbi:iron ABC transporter permease [Haloarculaceae archaeon H-GB2-1]|nr:iron ABC transporter permease [Haloarculaceae archaeon H-GB11]MEA5408114.1 iron ABC transporter permease [Haloarculaceae archaeon H-GB2-1]